MTDASWHAVPGYPGYMVTHGGHVLGKRGFVLKPQLTKVGRYAQVHLQLEGGRKTVRVHTLVLITFRGPRPPGLEGCHRNGDKTNNDVENLYWGTRSDNMRDRFAHGDWIPSGSRNPRAKLTEGQVLQLRIDRAAHGETYDHLAERFGISASSVAGIVKRVTWKHI